MSFFDTGSKLFKRLNTTNELKKGSVEILDNQEINKAKQMGFSLFELKEGMNADDFAKAYEAAIKNAPDNVKQFEEKTKEIHVKYLQVKYKTSENPKENETIEEYEQRLYLMTKNESKSAMERSFEARLQELPPMSTTTQENTEYIVDFFEDLSRDLINQEMLDKKVDEILKGEKTISFKDLENNSIISDIMQNLDDDVRKKVEFITKLENSSQKVTEKELRLILTLLDVDPIVGTRSENSKLKGFVIDGKLSTFVRNLNTISEKDLELAFNLMLTKEERNSYLEKNKEIYSKYNDANGKITAENLENLVNELVAPTGLFEEFPKMKQAILKDLSFLIDKNWEESFEEVKGSILGSINISRIAAAYAAEKETHKSVNEFNLGGKKVDKMIDNVRSNLNIL